jgi:D-sedoheptulose 7-phosphate isomerase
VESYHEGVSPPSFDKQFVRDYLESLDWNKRAPGPRLAPEVIARTLGVALTVLDTTDPDAVRAALVAAAAAVRAGGRVLALGNGGSATDATDVVADLQAGGRAAVDLTADPAILTAIANDVGVEAIFTRQVIAYGRPRDVLLAFSTSGGSANVIAALAEARRRGLVTVAFVGYDGGRIAGEGLADQVVVTRSQHIPRIQEAQASAYHVLCELLS